VTDQKTSKVLSISFKLTVTQTIPCPYTTQTSLQCSPKPLLNPILQYHQFTPLYHPFPRSILVLSLHLYPDLSSTPFLNDFPIT